MQTVVVRQYRLLSTNIESTCPQLQKPFFLQKLTIIFTMLFGHGRFCLK